MVRRLAAAAEVAGRPARVHLKADTGLSRGGATAADWPAVLAAASAGAGRRQHRRRRRLVAFRLGGRAGQPVDRGAARRVQGGPGGRGERGHHPAGAAHRQHRGRARRAAGPLRPGADRRRQLRPGHAARRGAGVAAARDDAAGPAGAREAGSRRAPGCRTGTGTPRRARRRSGWCRSATRTGYRAPRPACRSWPLAAAGGRSRARSAWTSWSSTSVMSRWRRGMRSCSSDRGTTGEPTAQEWGEALGTISYEIVTGIGARVPRSHHE